MCEILGSGSEGSLMLFLMSLDVQHLSKTDVTEKYHIKKGS